MVYNDDKSLKKLLKIICVCLLCANIANSFFFFYNTITDFYFTLIASKASNKKSLKIPKGGNQNPYIEEEQTTQWQTEKVQKDK
jgi:uncharacterized protein YxeA